MPLPKRPRGPRVCTGCHLELDAEDFAWRSSGLPVQPCKACCKVQRRARYLADHEAQLAYHRAKNARWRNNNREKVRAISRKTAADWLARNPKRARVIATASGRVGAAIKKGLLVRPENCGRCGSASFIEAAHHDYSKPLEVEWLCRPCHRRWDKLEPKSAVAA